MDTGFGLFSRAFDRKTDQLTTLITPTVAFINLLNTHGVIDKETQKDLIHEFTEQKLKPKEFNSRLLILLERKPNERFPGFCRALIDTDQKDIVTAHFLPFLQQSFISQYIGPSVVTVTAQQPQQPAPVATQPSNLPMPFRDALNGKLAKLAKLVDIENNAFLLPVLQDNGVINLEHVQTIEREANNPKKVGKLLEILKGRADTLFPKFIDSLYDCELKHVVEELWPNYARNS